MDGHKEALRYANISLWIDLYDDIFSDFDPRPYYERGLSEDFITELRKACKEKKDGKVQLHILVPEKERNLKQESVIKKRLRAHYKKSAGRVKKEADKIRNMGLLVAFIGVILMFIATYAYGFMGEGVFASALFVLTEPAGWFMAWYGLDRVFYDARQHRKNLDVMERMSIAEIVFSSY